MTQEDLPVAAGESERYILWDFEASSERTKLMSLWPADPDSPSRLKRHLLTRKEGVDLRIRVNGADPGFIWQFGQPTTAGSFQVEATSRAPTSVQLFWAGTTCRAFAERCSLHLPLPAGSGAVGAPLPPEPLSELRLDFEQTEGVELVIHSMSLGDAVIHHGAWIVTFEGTFVTSGPDGLLVDASHDDPWIETGLPEVPARMASTVTITLDAPADTTAQLFWRGSECPFFAAECSASFAPMTAGLTATSLDVSPVPTWKGTLSGLRLDPGTTPGQYRILRIVLGTPPD